MDRVESKLDRQEGKLDKTEAKLDHLHFKADRTREFLQFSPEDWKVARAIGGKIRGTLPLPGPTKAAFSVESIRLPADGFQVIGLVVDGIATDVRSRNAVTPCNLLVTLGLALIGASASVSIECEDPYTGPVEFNGEKPQALRLCTFVHGAGSSQQSPDPCPS